MEIETYNEKLTCGNCGEEQIRQIPKGQSVADYIESHKCERCECPKLNRYIIKVL